jgi:hypothetical protein
MPDEEERNREERALEMARRICCASQAVVQSALVDFERLIGKPSKLVEKALRHRLTEATQKIIKDYFGESIED